MAPQARSQDYSHLPLIEQLQIAAHPRIFRPRIPSTSPKRELKPRHVTNCLLHTTPKTSFKRPPKLERRVSENGRSLDQLKSIERKNNHKWTSPERELLCVIFRWLESPEAPMDLAVLFNELRGLDLRPSTIQQQYKGHICLFGPNAFPELMRVSAMPFKRPSEYYTSVIEYALSVAKDLELSVRKRTAEEFIDSGMAAVAKSPQTRRTCKRLKRQARIAARQQGRGSIHDQLLTIQHNSPPRSSDSRGRSMVVESWNEWEDYVDNEEIHEIGDVRLISPLQALPAAVEFESIYRPQNLAFRVWDNNKSRTSYTPKQGFRSRVLASWYGEEPAPPQDGETYLKILASAHFSLQGGDSSIFVSTTTSLVQALTYASSMENPLLAIIDLSHPSLERPYKKFKGLELLKWLKESGQARWAKYQGLTEMLIWGSIGPEAILQTLSVDELSTDRVLNNFFQLDLFKPKGSKRQSTREVCRQLRDRNTVLDEAQAVMMAEVVQLFGSGGTSTMNMDHVAELVTVIVDGWTIRPDLTSDVTLGRLGAVFAKCLTGSLVLRIQLQRAFVRGVEQGLRNLEYFNGHYKRKAKRT